MPRTESLVAESPYVRRTRRADASHRLFCFPHAGAGASYFADWPGLLPPTVEVLAIQLPGREDRSKERPFTESAPLLRNLAAALRPYLHGSFSFFGHSAGALVAFELTRALHQRRRPLPRYLFLSGQPAPHRKSPVSPIHQLPESDFREAVTEIGGFTSTVSSDEELVRLLIPTLRADFQLWETHDFQPGPPVPSSIAALGGRGDRRAPVADVEAWAEHTDGDFRSVFFDGDHFYLRAAVGDVLGLIGGTVSGAADRPGEVPPR